MTQPTERATPLFVDITARDSDVHGPELAAAQAASWHADTPIDPAVVAYKDVAVLFLDRRLGSGLAAHLDIQGIPDGPRRDWWAEMILCQNGPTHERLGRLLVPAFRPPIIDALRPRMREQIVDIVERLLAPSGEGSCDAVEAIADPYPIAVLSDLIDIPTDERADVRRWRPISAWRSACRSPSTCRRSSRRWPACTRWPSG